MAVNFSKLGKNIGKQIKDNIRQNYLKRFWKELGKGVTLVSVVLDLIKKGISPTSAGRFVKYSKSYVDSIKGKVAFFTNKTTGGTFAIAPLATSELKSYRASKQAIKDNRDIASKVKKISRERYGDKKQSPVNMELSGDMLDSLTFNTSKGVLGFSDKKAKWHNEGEGKLPVRRLLPNNPGERFNRRAEQRIRQGLSDAVRKEARNPANFLSIKIKLK